MHEQTPENLPEGREVEIRKENLGGEGKRGEGEGSPSPKAPKLKRIQLTILLYVLVDPRDGTVRYVGKTNYTLKKRLREHRNNPRNNYLACWVRSLKELGLTPIIEEIDRVEDSNDKDWQRVERYWISFYRNMHCDLVNLDSGGTGGHEKSEETKKKIGDANRGKVRSPETLEKLRVAQTGKKRSPEHCANMSKAVKGTKLGPRPPEVLEKISKALMGKKRPRTPEHQAKLTAKLIGREVKQETRDKISQFQKGKKRGPYSEERVAKSVAGMTPEARKKMSDASLKRWGKLPKDHPPHPPQPPPTDQQP